MYALPLPLHLVARVKHQICLPDKVCPRSTHNLVTQATKMWRFWWHLFLSELKSWRDSCTKLWFLTNMCGLVPVTLAPSTTQQTISDVEGSQATRAKS
jgi:hypothetical protein